MDEMILPGHSPHDRWMRMALDEARVGTRASDGRGGRAVEVLVLGREAGDGEGLGVHRAGGGFGGE